MSAVQPYFFYFTISIIWALLDIVCDSVCASLYHSHLLSWLSPSLKCFAFLVFNFLHAVFGLQRARSWDGKTLKFKKTTQFLNFV